MSARAWWRAWAAVCCWPSRFSSARQHGHRLLLRWGGGGGGRPAGAGRAGVGGGGPGDRARARGRAGPFRRWGEDVGEVDLGAAGQGHVGVLAVLGAADHGQPGGHGAALGGVVGDRVAQFGILAGVDHKLSVGPAALPGGRVGVQGAADEQAVWGDGVDAEQVAVGQGPAGFAGLDGVVVAGADDQVTGAGGGAVGDPHHGAGLDGADGDEVVADAAVQFAAQRVVRGHQQGVGAVQGQREVGGRGGVHHLLRVAAADAAVLVVLGQHAGVPLAEPQAGGLFPGGAEPDRVGELGVAKGAGEQGHAAAVFHRLQLLGIPGQDHLGAGRGRLADDVGQVRVRDHGRLVHQDQVAGPQLDGPAGAAAAGQVAQELRAVVGHRDPGGQGVAGRLGRRDPDHPAEPGPGPGPARPRPAPTSCRTRRAR